MTARHVAAGAGGALAAILIALVVLRAVGGDGVREQPVPPAVVWAVGDGANGSEDARAVAQRMSAEPFDRLLYLGDVYDRGTWEDFQRNYDPVYGHMAHRTAPTPGNHDWGNRESGYLPYWEQMHGGRPIEPWYAFRLNGWEILSLNSEEPVGPGSPQHEWLKRQLTEPGDCRIAYWHSPRFSASTEHHGDDPEMEPLWQALKGHATVILGAHDHDMQRFAPIDGMTQFVSGAGGHHHYELDEDPRLAFGNDTDYGALRLELSPGVVKHAFVTADGRQLDRGTLRCEAG